MIKKKNYTMQGPFPGPLEARAPILGIGCTLYRPLHAPDARYTRNWVIFLIWILNLLVFLPFN